MTKQGRRDALVLDTHGWLLTLAGDTDQGIDKLRTALQIKRIPDAHYHLGEAYLKKDFAEEAVHELQMAHDLYKELKETKQPVDPSLEAKIEGSLAKATMMANRRTSRMSTANAAPTGARDVAATVASAVPMERRDATVSKTTWKPELSNTTLRTMAGKPPGKLPSVALCCAVSG
jgi:tetratricopeptide (TPR) repeat protein